MRRRSPRTAPWCRSRFRCNVPGTTAIAVVIEKNRSRSPARFEFKEGALPFVKLNVKMGETSDVRVIAIAGGQQYTATQARSRSHRRVRRLTWRDR